MADNDDDDNGMAPHNPHMADAPLPDNHPVEEAMLPGEVPGVETEPAEIPGVEAPEVSGEHNVAVEPGVQIHAKRVQKSNCDGRPSAHRP